MVNRDFGLFFMCITVGRYKIVFNDEIFVIINKSVIIKISI